MAQVFDGSSPSAEPLFSNSASALSARAAWSCEPGAPERAAKASAQVGPAMAPGGGGEMSHLGLLALGAHPDAVSAWGQSWISWGAEHGFSSLCRALSSLGANLNSGHPVARALDSGYFDLAAELIESGARVSEHPARQVPLLHKAVQAHSVKMIECLVRHGAPIDDRDEMSRTALIKSCAISPPRAASALLLLELGADPEARDVAGQSAADYAEQHGDPELADELRGAELRAREKRQIGAAARPSLSLPASPRL